MWRDTPSRKQPGADNSAELNSLIEAAIVQFAQRFLTKIRSFQSTQALLRDVSLCLRMPASLHTPYSASFSPCEDNWPRQFSDLGDIDSEDQTPPPDEPEATPTPRRKRRRRHRPQGQQGAACHSALRPPLKTVMTMMQQPRVNSATPQCGRCLKPDVHAAEG